MPMLFDTACRCCMLRPRTHCKDCWDSFHHGREHGDWEDRGEGRKSYDCGHDAYRISLDDRNSKTIQLFLKWATTDGFMGSFKKCWECWKESY